MNDRRQERIGWIAGWFGGFVWVLILSILFAVQGRLGQAAGGFLIVCLACVSILRLSPWRYPSTRLRTLMLPIYFLFLISLAWGISAMEDPRQLGITSWWSAFLLLPIAIPLWTAGNRRWGESDDPGR